MRKRQLGAGRDRVDGHDHESRLTCSHVTVGGECRRMGGVGAFTADRGALHVDDLGQKA